MGSIFPLKQVRTVILHEPEGGNLKIASFPFKGRNEKPTVVIGCVSRKKKTEIFGKLSGAI